MVAKLSLGACLGIEYFIWICGRISFLEENLLYFKPYSSKDFLFFLRVDKDSLIEVDISSSDGLLLKFIYLRGSVEIMQLLPPLSPRATSPSPEISSQISVVIISQGLKPHTAMQYY